MGLPPPEARLAKSAGASRGQVGVQQKGALPTLTSCLRSARKKAFTLPSHQMEARASEVHPKLNFDPEPGLARAASARRPLRERQAYMVLIWTRNKKHTALHCKTPAALCRAVVMAAAVNFRLIASHLVSTPTDRGRNVVFSLGPAHPDSFDFLICHADNIKT